MKAAFFKHGEKDNLRACVKAIKFCSSESQGELQDFAQNQIKDLEDDLVAKLKSAMKDVMVAILQSFYFMYLHDDPRIDLLLVHRTVVMSTPCL